MRAKDWIKQAQQAGWRVVGVHARCIDLRCTHQGCPSSRRIPLDALGSPPEPCSLPHAGQYARPVLDSYAALIAEMVRKRRSLGLDQTDLCAAMGLADGHLSKLEAMDRIASPPTLLLWAQSLGLILTTAPAPLPTATIAAIDRRTDRPYAVSQVRSKPRQIPLW